MTNIPIYFLCTLQNCGEVLEVYCICNAPPHSLSYSLSKQNDNLRFSGPETVVGKNRSKVFSDGSPNRKTERVVPDLSISNVLDVRSEVENCQQGKQISSPCRYNAHNCKFV